MQIAFCVRGTSPLLLFLYSQAAKQIDSPPTRPLPHELHLVRNADDHITIPSQDFVRVLRAGALMLPREMRDGMRVVFTSRAERLFNDARCLDPRSNAPFTTCSIEPIVIEKVHAMNVPRLNEWTVQGTMVIDDDQDSGAIKCALEVGSTAIGLGFPGQREHGPWGRFTVTEWRHLATSSTSCSASLHQLEA